MPKKQQRHPAKLSRRERQIMDILHRRGEATVAEVLAEMADPPSYSAVRSTLGILESKGHATHRNEANRYIYLPTVDPRSARRSAMDHLLETFFAGSAADAVTALLEEQGSRLSTDEVDRLTELIEKAREEGR